MLAGDGAEGAKQAFDRKFDVIFMDLSMPNMNGWDAARLIRSRNGAKSRYTPIYALTAHALPEEQKALLEAGMDGCILKPFRSRNLKEVLSNIRTSLDRKTEGGTTSVNAAENVVDRSVVDELRDVLGPTMFENKLNDFLREMELVGKQLREKAKSESWEHLAKLAHKFAGSASVFGASGLKD